MEFYCEKAVWKFLPSIRRILCKSLIKKGLKREDLARIFGITEAAISQYMNSKRGMKLKMENKLKREIENVANRIFEQYEKNRINKKIIANEICYICSLIKDRRCS